MEENELEEARKAAELATECLDDIEENDSQDDEDEAAKLLRKKRGQRRKLPRKNGKCKYRLRRKMRRK